MHWSHHEPAALPGPHYWRRYLHRTLWFHYVGTLNTLIRAQLYHLFPLLSPTYRIIRPSWKPGFSPICAIVQSDHKLLPGKYFFKREVFWHPDIFLQLITIYINIFMLKTPFYMRDKQLLLFAYCIDFFSQLYQSIPEYMDVCYSSSSSSPESSPTGLIPRLSSILSIWALTLILWSIDHFSFALFDLLHYYSQR